jgi:hypothetical protein
MATKSKHRKNHKQRVQARNNRLANEKMQAQKAQREFIKELIKQEQDKGMFDNTTPLSGSIIDGPIIDGPIINGPQI